MREKSRPMSDAVRYFIRALGNHNELKIKSMEHENLFALGFYNEFEFNSFRAHFDQLYEKVKQPVAVNFGAHPLDKICYEFIEHVYLGIRDEEEPYQIEHVPAQQIRWINFNPQEQIYLVARAFFQLHEAYTEAWEFDDEEGYERFYRSAQ